MEVNEDCKRTMDYLQYLFDPIPPEGILFLNTYTDLLNYEEHFGSRNTRIKTKEYCKMFRFEIVTQTEPEFCRIMQGV